MSGEDIQYVVGIVVIIVGLLVIVGAAIAAVIKAIRDALGSGSESITAQDLSEAVDLDVGEIIGTLLKPAITLAIVAGALIMWLGICMANGGTWLWIVDFADPRPPALARIT